ncbi:MAG: hypothetical protein RMK02_10200 [Burkholderiales bacterium]|nr:hypothetical protein [Burkholderiales bacterium]
MRSQGGSLPAATPRLWESLTLLGAVALAMAGQLLGLASAIVEIDIARDLTEGFAILDGEVHPRQGPQIGGIFHLGPWWFYLVAAVLLLSPSLTAYTLIMGALASLKFPIAAWVGLRLAGPRFAALLVAASALPGVAAYQFFGVSHTSFVELFVWLGGALLLEGRRCLARPHAQTIWCFLSGLAFCLALHAHPTALAWTPFWFVGLVWAAGNGPRAMVCILAGLLGAVLPLLPMLPALWQEWLDWRDPAQRPAHARAVGDSLASVVPLLRGVLWSEPERIAGTAFAAGERAPLLWRWIWGGGSAGACWLLHAGSFAQEPRFGCRLASLFWPWLLFRFFWPGRPRSRRFTRPFPSCPCLRLCLPAGGWQRCDCLVGRFFYRFWLARSCFSRPQRWRLPSAHKAVGFVCALPSPAA